MSILPGNRFARFRFYAPIGVEDVRLSDHSIIGRWKVQPTRFYGETEKTLAERFANWGREEIDIQNFTERYGPLAGSRFDGPQFRFAVAAWRSNQQEFRKYWCEVEQGHVGKHEPLQGSTIEIRRGWLDFCCGALWTFMTLELLSEVEKVRICERPDCSKNKYFVAQHGKERYCSPDCANWSQARLKMRWHEQQRQKRKQERGKVNGTDKTR